MEGRTSVVIAHHLDTVRHADVIFVIKDSEIVEQGTHEALLATGGVYSELYEMQRRHGPKDPERSEVAWIVFNRVAAA